MEAQFIEHLLTLINVMLYIVMLIECFTIINVLASRQFRINLLNGKVSIMNLLQSWRMILLAICLGGLREAYYLLEQWVGLEILDTIPYLYELLGTGFLLALVLGLYEYLMSAKEIQDYIETQKAVDEIEASLPR